MAQGQGKGSRATHPAIAAIITRGHSGHPSQGINARAFVLGTLDYRYPVTAPRFGSLTVGGGDGTGRPYDSITARRIHT